ncbi:fumarylacetoacetate hydrolase family protein [Mycobacterium paraterrae]|uniref:Fumarylacetoacetate hydrolase family protein n=1 Tax=Mycobacterium paraterrae TaxID=577492 RepID=A0ABY3VN67_9MYCO|nr:fumarylacetoacetate hydrolase family protein [Mycobacterium paraterrae]UMB70642.1 fumarylacetoacetate hydrolase family protein [Mycobacterium paraterrae]
MTRLYQTSEGIARGEGDGLVLLDLPADLTIAALLAEPGVDPASTPVRQRLPLADATLEAPVSLRSTIYLLGLNYHSHVAEIGASAPAAPIGLPIPATAIATPHQPITLPEAAPSRVDYEGEIAIVVGASCHALAPGYGWDHIAGLCVANDVSARDIQERGMRDGQLVDVGEVIRAKSFPTFKPLGPCIVSADEVRDGAELAITTRVNGEQRQHSSTSDMIFDFARIVEGISHQAELACGDVILTGTPSGVGLAEGRFLVAGDVVEVEVGGIGVIRNVVSG